MPLPRKASTSQRVCIADKPTINPPDIVTNVLTIIQKTRDDLDFAIQRITEEHDLDFAIQRITEEHEQQSAAFEKSEAEQETFEGSPGDVAINDVELPPPQEMAMAPMESRVSERPAFLRPELREVWIQVGHKGRRHKTARSTLVFDDPSSSFKLHEIVHHDTECWLEQIMTRYTIAPSNIGRVFWDLIGAFLVACDMISIPLQVFEIPQNTASTTLGWITLLFWTTDMFFTFFVGYPSKGKIVMRPWSIARHYFRSWFLLDAILVIGDWFTTASGSKNAEADSDAADVSGFSKMLRVLRALRVLRLLRLLKMKRLLEELEEMLDSEYVQLMFSLIKLVMGVLFLNHMLACLWFWVGNGDGEKHWVTAYGMKDKEIAYQYVISLHWALTQFTPATQNVHPRNFLERLLATLIVILALVTFSTFVSTLTATMTQLRKVAADETKQFLTLRRYLHQQKVKTELRRRIVKYLEFAYRSRKHNIREGSVSLLELLSDPLRDELAHARSTPSLAVHPFLSSVNATWTQLMRRLSRLAFGQVHFAADDGIFHSGDSASRMYFLVTGDVDYQRQGKQSLTSALAIHDWAAEAALWGTWHYVGDLVSRTECEVMSIEAIKFGQAMSMNLEVLHVASAYATEFIRALRDMDPDDYSDILQKDFVRDRLSVS